MDVEYSPKRQAEGLSRQEAKRRLQQNGPNELPEIPPPGPLKIFVRQFLNPFIYILLAAAIVSFALGQLPSTVFIVIVLLVNALIGTIQEFSAQKAAAALRSMVKGEARVVRDGTPQTVDIEEIVPGDLILLSSGDKVPADIELISARDLAVDESMLTGESVAVTKNADAEVAGDAPLTDRINACFAGSMITHGRAQGLVIHTGERTELGKIAREVGGKRLAEPPLMIRIRQFTYRLAGAIILAIAALTLLMLVRGGYDTREMLMMSIGLAVSVIPEGLPAALTVALAIGMSRMAKVKVIIRKLVAVEALGSCTFICSDKTGTLTVNELTIRQVVLPDGSSFTISGEGIAPGGGVVDELGETQRDHLRELCIAGTLANESHLDYAGGEWVSDGDVVDVAFLVLAKKVGLSISELRRSRQELELFPYESEKAYSGSINRCGDTDYLFAKGSPERMLEMCQHMMLGERRVEIDRARITREFEALAARGYRIIALAKKDLGEHGEHFRGMTFLGMVAMIDPVRPEAVSAIAQCREGGIEVAMITGDHPATAKSIAMELGLCGEDDDAVTGTMLHQADAEGRDAMDRLVTPARVFARIEPRQKEQIVDCFKRQGHFVAVTGDGVNDAPAMRHANTGIAMGRRGTDVARETADLIITDDNFASIVAGIEQGRVVYNNIRKVIGLLVATGFSAILLFFLCVLAGFPMPMIAVQLLWLNLVANGFQDVALAFEPREGGELDRPPRPPAEPIMERRIIEHILVAGTLMGGVAFANFYYCMHSGMSVEESRNLTLMLMVLFGNIHTLNSRSETASIFRISLRRNLFLAFAVPVAQLMHIGAMYTPLLGDVLQIRPISPAQWFQLLLMASSLLAVEELHKWHIRRKRAGAAITGSGEPAHSSA